MGTLMSLCTFRREFFEPGSRPSKSLIAAWVEEGKILGLIVGDQVYVDRSDPKVTELVSARAGFRKNSANERHKGRLGANPILDQLIIT